MSPFFIKLHNALLGKRAAGYLCLASAILLLGWLSGHPIWTQEYRWQQVCLHMLQSGDYLHPYLDGQPYYDKPLLSYWFMLAVAKLTGSLDLIALRSPSIVAAGLALYCVFSIGRYWFDRITGLYAAWLLLTTFYFVFWARVASTDMLNLTAVIAPCAWLFANAHRLERVKSQAVLLLLGVVGALLKGLIAPVLTLLVMLPWLMEHRRYRAFCQWRSLLLVLLALGLYVSPFIASSLVNQHSYQENGLVEVFQENILRFFKPFDHQGGIQTYFIYAPLYLLPWTPLWLLSLYRYVSTWRHQSPGVKWLVWANVVIFGFLSLSGSRRSYYILPLLPFAILQCACWWQQYMAHKAVWQTRLLLSLCLIYGLLFSYFVILQPCYYLSH